MPVRRARRGRPAPVRSAGDGVAPEARDRASLLMARNLLAGRAGNRANPGQNEVRPRIDRGAHAHDLERIDQLRPRHHPRRPRAGDEAGRAPVRRLVPAAAPRVHDADQAEALVPGARARGRARRDREGLGGREGPVRDRRGRRPRGARATRRLALDRDHALRRRSTRSIPSTSTAPTSSFPARRAGAAAARTCCCSRRCGRRAPARSAGSCAREGRSSA